ncbi:hypothetical protein Ddye_019871 [Dipteronia dyeriana]|uniref:Uncharacterized protein n=1 Tax=Dipteronia dyeriana TaxID=168575 RepID=A0AAD9TZ20_9ROSI|nr:hypothetical protein Ddye_019871 [Dipteronia dyeriana]
MEYERKQLPKLVLGFCFLLFGAGQPDVITTSVEEVSSNSKPLISNTESSPALGYLAAGIFDGLGFGSAQHYSSGYWEWPGRVTPPKRQYQGRLPDNDEKGLIMEDLVNMFLNVWAVVLVVYGNWWEMGDEVPGFMENGGGLWGF